MKMSIPKKAIYRFNAIPMKTTFTQPFTELKVNHLKICMEGQKNPNSQSNLEQKEYCWGINILSLEFYERTIVIKDNIILT